MLPTCTIVSYDICDPKRWRRVYHICRAYGEHIQYSVFRADLTPTARAALVAELATVINHREDQVLLIDVGPAEGRAREAFLAVGRRYEPPERYVRVL